ncbi:hypothetical protein [Streptomyces armeniacus]|uniref:hypothetical protein n=1 Tax=Streptomyces armeniacus TaxID=83291 RepID=UPI001FE27BA4|nr:hypothetical protein [Streptomyces armeniacus]
MSDTQRPDEPERTAGKAARQPEPEYDPDAPVPEPIRFFGTTWVDRTGGYAVRRACLVVGALTATVVGAYALRLAYEGVAISELGAWARFMLILVFAVASSVGFSRTLTRFSRRPGDTPEDEARERSMRSIMLVGFLGILLAYGLRGLVEAPGEKMRRTEYEEALRRHRRRRSSRTGNPAKRKRKR